MSTELEELNKAMAAKPIGKVPADFKPMFIETYSMDNEGRTLCHKLDLTTGKSSSDIMIDNREKEFMEWQAYLTKVACSIFKIPESEFGINKERI
jgi:hypothetical protein